MPAITSLVSAPSYLPTGFCWACCLDGTTIWYYPCLQTPACLLSPLQVNAHALLTWYLIPHVS